MLLIFRWRYAFFQRVYISEEYNYVDILNTLSNITSNMMQLQMRKQWNWYEPMYTIDSIITGNCACRFKKSCEYAKEDQGIEKQKRVKKIVKSSLLEGIFVDDNGVNLCCHCIYTCFYIFILYWYNSWYLCTTHSTIVDENPIYIYLERIIVWAKWRTFEYGHNS